MEGPTAEGDADAPVRSSRMQATVIAANDPAGDELQRFVDAVYEWPKR